MTGLVVTNEWEPEMSKEVAIFLLTNAVLMNGCAPSIYLNPHFEQTRPKKIAVFPFYSQVLIPEGVSESAGLMASDLLSQKGYAVIDQKKIAITFKELGIGDPGQVRCCLDFAANQF